MLCSGGAQAPAETSTTLSDAQQAAADPTEDGRAAANAGEQAGTKAAITTLADGQAGTEGLNTPAKDQLSSPHPAAGEGQVMPAYTAFL